MQGAMVSGPIMVTPSGVCTLHHAITKQSELPYYCTSVAKLLSTMQLHRVGVQGYIIATEQLNYILDCVASFYS